MQDIVKTLLNYEEFVSCTEAEREEECKSTVNQLVVQIQELQDKVKSLSDSREFYDPETASSSR